MKRAAAGALLATLALASSARAHGGPPVIKSALAADSSGPFLVELSEGFAMRSGDAWSFVCPALFGADLPPPTTSLGDAALFAGAADLYRLDAAQEALALDHPDLAGSRVLSMTALDGELVALRLRAADADGGAGTEVVRLSGDTVETLFEGPEYWSTLAALPAGSGSEPQLWLARIDSEGIELLTVGLDTAEQHRELVVLPLTPQSLRLGTAGEHVFCHVVENGGYALLHVATQGMPPLAASQVATARLPFAGPALRGEDILLMRDGELLRWTNEGLEAKASPLGAEPLTCLSAQHACSAGGLLYDADEVERAGSFAEAEPVFDLARLAPPELMPEVQERKDACTLQWIVFRSDLVRAGILEASGAPDAGAGPTTDAGAAEGPPDASADGAMPGAAPAPAQRASGCSILPKGPHESGRALCALGLSALAFRRLSRAKRRIAC